MSELNKKLYPEYTVDRITNSMGLRKPQKISLEILDDILSDIDLSKNQDLETAKKKIHDKYPEFSDFDHDFMSLTFALATGVGKTKLMGTFITYLYTNKGIKNFFVVAPNLTIYEKLLNDLGTERDDNQKYVFKGVGCFAVKKIRIWTGEDYLKNNPYFSTIESDVNVFIYNISKFNSDNRNIMERNETQSKSFYDWLSSLDDLAVIMDESHHYRAKASAKAISRLHPVLGIELTATPRVVKSNGKSEKFRNIVYEYPLSHAIKDGYTRVPYAMTRSDFHPENLSSKKLDEMMISDGIANHERVKAELQSYANDNHLPRVKPFMLIVCRDTEHAKEIFDYITSPKFCGEHYRDKVLVIHSNQTGAEKDENIKRLLSLEKPENTIEIVVHVNMLKEGWDVNNLYTIVPLRKADSRVLLEQTLGRGLRLPYGHRTGNKTVDSVVITAHNNFQEIIAEAMSPDSLIRRDNFIYVTQSRPVDNFVASRNYRNSDIETISGQVALDVGEARGEKECTPLICEDVLRAARDFMSNNLDGQSDSVDQQAMANSAAAAIREAHPNVENPLDVVQAILGTQSARAFLDRVKADRLYIPRLLVRQSGREDYSIQNFDLDMSRMIYSPVTERFVLANLLTNERIQIDGVSSNSIDYLMINPRNLLVSAICEDSRIDYEKCSAIIQKCVDRFLTDYLSRFSDKDVKNIVIYYKKQIGAEIARQINEHLDISYNSIEEFIDGYRPVDSDRSFTGDGAVRDLNQPTRAGDSIQSFVFRSGTKCAYDLSKFDSEPERIFAVICESSPEVKCWFRPSLKQFGITYSNGHDYQPDFFVETGDCYYLVEIKARNRLQDPDVLAKKDRAVKYCQLASDYNRQRGHKQLKYLFIPHDEIALNSSFENLKTRFQEL